MKYSQAVLEKSLNMELQKKTGFWLTSPSTDVDHYKHKVKFNKKTGKYECDCTYYQVNMNKNNLLCSHVLAVMYQEDKRKFWKVVSAHD